MNIYYTAKDIEEMAANGIQQLEVGPGVTLTDFARETAQQFNIELVDSSKQESPSKPATPPRRQPVVSAKYNKPSGCQHATTSHPSAGSQSATSTSQATTRSDSSTVNRLIDLMGKAVKRGG